MNKLSKILIAIIVLLAIAFGVSTYYFIYYRDAYFTVANEMYRIVQENEKNSNNINE